jgi:hypothetical protein
MKLLGLILFSTALMACSGQGGAGADEKSASYANESATALGGLNSVAALAPTNAVSTPATSANKAKSDPCDDYKNPAFDPDKCVEPEFRVDRLVGRWKITKAHVSAEGVQAAAENDPSIIGSEFALTTEEMKWVSKASDSFFGSDVCTKPIAGPQSSIVEKESAASLIAAAKHWAIAPASRGKLHRFGCNNGGSWGPDSAGASLFYEVGKSQIIMQWFDGVTLLVERQAG